MRINSIRTPWAHEDIIELLTGAGDSIDFLAVPKVAAARDIWWVDVLLEQLESKLNLSRRIGLEAIIETAQGLANVERIAGASDRLEALMFGTGDLAASLQTRVDSNLQPVGDYYPDFWGYARTRVLVAARAAGIQAVDAAYPDFSDLEGYRLAAIRAATHGYDGKWAIHPDQVPIANEAFAPTQVDVEWAQEIVSEYADAHANGRGALNVRGVMIDAAHVRLAHNVLVRAGQEGGQGDPFRSM